MPKSRPRLHWRWIKICSTCRWAPFERDALPGYLGGHIRSQPTPRRSNCSSLESPHNVIACAAIAKGLSWPDPSQVSGSLQTTFGLTDPSLSHLPSVHLNGSLGPTWNLKYIPSSWLPRLWLLVFKALYFVFGKPFLVWFDDQGI